MGCSDPLWAARTARPTTVRYNNHPEVQQVFGIGSSHVETNGEGHPSVTLDDALESLLQECIASSGLGESQLVGSGLEVVT